MSELPPPPRSRFGRGRSDEEARAQNHSPAQNYAMIAAQIRMTHDPRPTSEVLAQEAYAYLREVQGGTR